MGSSIKKNYIYNTVYQLLILITPLITAPYTARVFGVDGIGTQSYVNSVASYFTLFAALGTSIYGQREIASCRDDKKKVSKLFWEVELVSIICTGVCLAIWLIIIIVNDQYRMYYLVLTMTIFAVAFDVSWFFVGLENFRITVIRNIIIRIIGIFILFTFIKDKSDLFLYVALMAATGLLGNISVWFGLPKYLKKVKLSELSVIHHFRETVVYFIPTLALSIYTILDKIMIGMITGDAYENGYYEQAQKIITLVKTLIFSLNTVMSSRMSYLFTNGKLDEVKQKLQNSLDFAMILGIPMMFGVAGIAKIFVPLYFGDGYYKTIQLLWISCILIVVTSISNLIGHQYMIPSGQRARSSKAVFIGAACNFLLNAIMIPQLASTGAMIASVIAEMIITIIYIRMSGKFITFRMIANSSIKRLFAGMIMFVIVFMIGEISDSNVITLLIQFIIGGLLYSVILLLMRDSVLIYIIKQILLKIRFIGKRQ